MNNQFANMQKLAFGKSIDTREPLNESSLREKIKELVKSSVDEAKKKKKETPEDVAPQEDTEEITDTEVTDTITPDITTDEIDIDPKVKAIQDSLSKALANAKALGDEKLVNQIGNTITMLVRTQVVGQQAVAENLEEVEIDGKEDKIYFLADALRHVWFKGKGNNSVDFEDMARSTINDLETRF